MGDCFLSRDADCVLLGLDLKVDLIDAGKLYDGDKVVALPEDVDRGKRTNASGAASKPVALMLGVERALKREDRIKRAVEVCQHGGCLLAKMFAAPVQAANQVTLVGKPRGGIARRSPAGRPAPAHLAQPRSRCIAIACQPIQ